MKRIWVLPSAAAAAVMLLAVPRASSATSSGFVGGYDPTWSPDGSQIAFVGPAGWAPSPKTTNRVIVVSVRGSMSPHVVSVAPRGETLGEVRWAAGGRFIYLDSNYTLWSDTGTRGKAARRLTDVGPSGWDTFALSPNGQMVAFTASCNCNVPQGTEVGVVPASGGTAAQILPHPRDGLDAHPSFSPNGTSIIFARILTGNSAPPWPRNTSIEIEPVGGGTARGLHVHGDWPIFSPNGRWIAFASLSPKPGGALEVMPAAGGRPRLLVPKPKGSVVGPFAWAPDSKKLVFVDDTRIGTVDLRGRRTYFSLAGLRPGIGTPQWSPNGASIAFSAINKNSDFDARVYLIDADGTGLRRIG